jgi:hypothetical protein
VHTISDGRESDTDAQLNKAHLLGSFFTAVYGSQQQKTTKKQASGGVAEQPSLRLETLAATKSPIHRRSPATAPQLMYGGGEGC